LSVDGTITPSNLTFDGSSVTVSGAVNVADTLTLKNGSVLTHFGATTTSTYNLNVTAAAVSIDTTSKIDVSGKGYLGGNNSNYYGLTINNTNGSEQYNGGSYAGIGGVSIWGGGISGSYGSMQQPNELGSGGGACGSVPGGNGGGLVKLTTGMLTLNGNILANGDMVSNSGGSSGGGSGGGIYLNIGNLSGTGTISAQGGSVTGSPNSQYFGSGGGGRIAIYYNTNTLPVANIIATGGKSGDGTVAARNGGAGTIYLYQNVFPLAVTKAGTGTGMMQSTPAGITCGATCSGNFAKTSNVTLTATPDSGSAFSGWAGACSGTGTCTVTMDAAKTVTASFNLTPPPAPALTINPVTSPTTQRNQTLSGTMASGTTISVSVNGIATAGSVTYPTPTTWSCGIAYLVAGNNTVTVAATDTLGGKKTVDVFINYLSLDASVTPPSISADYQGNIALKILNIPTTENNVLVEQYVDANRNGVIDAGDYAIHSFTVTDGAASSNPNIQGDEDGAADGSVTTSLNYYMTGDLYHAPGNYILRMTSGSGVVSVPLNVASVISGQEISGIVIDGTNPVPGAIVRLTDKWQRTLAFGIADGAGRYTLNAKDPGNYYLAPAAYGLATPTGNIIPVNVAAGQNIANTNLALSAGTFHITGRVKDDTSGAGIGGVWVEAKGTNFRGIAVTDAGGNYDLLLPAGTYSVAASADTNGPAPFSKGYAVYSQQTISVNLVADTTGQDIALPNGSVLVKGRVVDQAGQGVPGVPVQGIIPAAVDSRGPISFGVTDGSGNYSINLYASGNWNIFPNDSFAQTRNYLSTNIKDFSTVTGPLSGNGLTVHQITAWVQGTVKDASGTPLSDVDVKLRNADSSETATLRTAADGSYRLGAYTGDWLVNAFTAEKGLNPVTERNVTLTDGQQVTIDFIADITPPSLNYTIWPGTAVPGVVDSGPDSPVALGVKFRADSNGYITGIRFYKASTNNGAHAGNLWTSAGTLLATATFSNETGSGWQQVNFSTPVAITANTVYVASYHTNGGHYSTDQNYFTATGVDNTPLHAPADGVSGFNGVFAYGSTSSFPSAGWNGTNYWVDVVFHQ